MHRKDWHIQLRVSLFILGECMIQYKLYYYLKGWTKGTCATNPIYKRNLIEETVYEKQKCLLIYHAWFSCFGIGLDNGNNFTKGYPWLYLLSPILKKSVGAFFMPRNGDVIYGY